MATAQEHSALCTHPRQGDKQRRHTKEATTERTHRDARHGFLNHVFTAVISQSLAALGQPSQIEREFFNSLSHLASLYGFSLPACKADYPLNIAQAFDHAQRQIKAIRRDLHLIIVKDEAHAATLATVRVFNTGTWLYYVPTHPLYLLLQDKRNRQRANLLLSVFAYLYQHAHMPYLTEGYMQDVYEMIESWYTDDPTAFDEDDHTEMQQEYRVMEYGSGWLLKSIKHPYHVAQFENRVLQFRPKTASDNILLTMATGLLGLYQQYPSRTVFDNIHAGLLDPKEEDRIMPHQYTSFFWKGWGMVYEQVMETVNMNFQEIACTEEPLTVQLFDAPQKEERHDHDFEQRFFDCIQELNEYLNEL